MTAEMTVITTSALIALNREQQHTMYGAPLGDMFRDLTAAYGITHAQLAATL